MTLQQLETAFLYFRAWVTAELNRISQKIEELTSCCRCSGTPYFRAVNNQILIQYEGGNWVLPEGFQQVSDLFPDGCLGGIDTDKGIVFFQDAIVFCQYVSVEDINDPNTGWQVYDFIKKP